ncbi:MAG: glycosyltransferase family 87 protein, partial [Candidatus Limnocylindria bacterium]
MTSGLRRRLPLVALVLVVVAELPLLIPPPFPLTDHLVFWQAGRMVASGASPYDMRIWTDVARSYQSGHLLPFVDAARPVWVYPAWTAFLFVPFGLLPYPAGPWLLYLAYFAVGLFAAALFIRTLPPRWQASAQPAIVLVAAFQPLLIANRYGQFGSFLLLGLVLVHRG